MNIGRNNWFKVILLMFQRFSISHYVVTSWKKETVRQTEWENETAWQTEGGEGGRISLWQPFHSLWMTFFFPLSILWDFKASISAEWFGPTIVWILNIHQGLSFAWGLRLCYGSAGISQYILPLLLIYLVPLQPYRYRLMSCVNEGIWI